MGESFKKLKQKYFTEAVIKGVVAGVSCGLFVVGVVLLTLKLCAVNINWAYYLLMGAVSSAASGFGLFFLIRPTDKKTAKRLDKEYSLNEKVQTMVEFADRTGEILTLQREKTSEILDNLPEFRFTAANVWRYVASRRIWIFAVCFVLSLAIFVTAVALPGKTVDGGENSDDPKNPPIDVPIDEDGEFSYSLEMIYSLSELIENVRISELGEGLKQSFVDELRALDKELQSADKVSQMKKAVNDTIVKIDGIVDTANSFGAFIDTAEKFDEYLKSAVERGIAVFKSSGLTFLNYSVVRSYNLILADNIETTFDKGQYLVNSRNKLIIPSEIQLERALGAYLEAFGAALDSAEADESDELYKSFDALYSDLTGVKNILFEGYDHQYRKSMIEKAYNDFRESITQALKTQVYNCIMDEFVRLNLKNIFSLTDEDLPPLPYEIIGTNEGGGDQTENPDGSGGFGDGNKLLGSDEVVFDPDKEEYVKYSEIIDKYYADIMNDILNGKVPEDLEDYLNLYYEYLYSGFKKDN